jgi:dihydroorotate dehydrogenase
MRILFNYQHPILTQKICNIIFDNPIWLAAWFDKDILLTDIVADIWFGREECGSITYGAYWWNTWTRLHRLVQSQWLVVNYGLKSKWIQYTKHMIKQSHCQVPLFVSIAKTNCQETCDLYTGIDDYVASLQELKSLEEINWFVLNISCPNSFGWENYAQPEYLQLLLEAVQRIWITKPIFIKLPSDASFDEIKKLIHTSLIYGIEWVIIGNLTKNREYISEKDQIVHIPWWISGKPTQHIVDTLIGEVYQEFWKKIIIVGVGWIFCAKDAYHKIKQGASLVQLITGMIFQWPQLIGEINAWLAQLLQQDWYSRIEEAIGGNFK